MTPPILANRIDELRHAIFDARRAIVDGATVTLGGLDAEVLSLTAAIADSLPEQEPPLRKALETLRDELDHLEAALRRQHDAVLARQAVDAYAGRGER